MVKVSILSKETIKPSNPTPLNLSSVPLSLFDQFSPPIYTHILLFYSNHSPNTLSNLKSSLIKTLNHFYPLAGRIKETNQGKLYVECNDEGVDYIETRVDMNLESVLTGSVEELHREFLPIKQSMFEYYHSNPLLAVQLNMLEDNGLILGLSICHLVADGTSLSMFLNWWAQIAHGCDESVLIGSMPRFDSAKVFPPKVIQTVPVPLQQANDDTTNNEQEVAIRCFTISGKAIERLRQGNCNKSTRVEAVSGLVWRCIRCAQREKRVAMSHVVNMRKRMGPMLFAESFGNLWVNVDISEREIHRCGGIEEGIRSTFRSVDEIYLKRKADEMREQGKGNGGLEREEGRVEWIFSSWCRMGWYKSDFGFGEPIWVGCGIWDMKNVCILMDTKDGCGMEVWLWMNREEMKRFERDSEFLEFVNC